MPILQLPHPSESLSVILPIEPEFENGKLDRWCESAYSFGSIYAVLGVLLPAVLARCDRASPQSVISYDRFRRLGFAIWDRKRMFAFGLANEPGNTELMGASRIEFLSNI